LSGKFDEPCLLQIYQLKQQKIRKKGTILNRKCILICFCSQLQYSRGKRLTILKKKYTAFIRLLKLQKVIVIASYFIIKKLNKQMQRSWPVLDTFYGSRILIKVMLAKT
jgi:hypothetical protein